jgi:crossover junction endodeoxyribonuclease RuvC
MLVLGIDPGSRTAGWGIVEEKGNTLKTLAYGTVKTPATIKELPRRLGHIFREFEKLAEKYSPDEVAVENVFFAENAKSALFLGQARAAAILPFVKAGLPVGEYTALQIKKAMTGQGRAEKRQVGKMVCRILGLKETPKPADITDALAVAICHIHSAPFLKRAAKV